MKTLIFLLILVSSIGNYSCGKSDPEKIYNPDVETYVELLKSNHYDSWSLPEFTHEDIPALLQYRDDNQMITNFPCNPLSSYYGTDCRLGMCILWTIESIRVVSIDSKYLEWRFPSQNPILAIRDADELQLVTDDISHSVASKAYYSWWENNKTKGFDEFKNIDPFADTEYRWH